MGAEQKKTITVEVECRQTVTYKQMIEVTEAEYELLIQADGFLVSKNSHGDDKRAYRTLDSKLDYGDISDGDSMLDIRNVRKVS